MKKKVLALFLSAALCVTVFPATGVAAEFGSGDAEITENAGDSQELFSAEETTEPMGETEQPAEDSEDISEEMWITLPMQPWKMWKTRKMRRTARMLSAELRKEFQKKSPVRMIRKYY